MGRPAAKQDLIELDISQPIWERFFWVAPLVLVGTREQDGKHDLAPKHMATPMGWENYYGFVCTPRHHTYSNIEREGVFTVSYPRPSQLVLTSLAASPRCGAEEKPALSVLPVFPASTTPWIAALPAVFRNARRLLRRCFSVMRRYLLVLAPRPTPPSYPATRRIVGEGVVVLALLAAVTWYVFGSRAYAGVLHQAMIYVIFPFMIWTALRLGQRGAATAVFLKLASSLPIT